MNIKIPIENLKLNTVIANDVYTEDFKLIITKGTRLTDKVLSRLKLFNIEYVYINNNEKEDLTPYNPSAEFKKFKETYIKVSDSLENSLNNIVERNISEADLKDTINSCIALYHSSSSSYGVLDMLHNMRNFSDSTYVHSLNVGMIAAIIGKWSGKSPEDEHLLMSCGLLHDIGKLVIPKEILNKPGKLTDEEFDIMKAHTLKGYELLKDLPVHEHIKLCALMHHEKLNGSGYPLKLTADQIDDFAKIITIADIYDALTANRVYRKSICPFDAIEVFEQDGYQLYDTKYLLTFLQSVLNSYMHSEVILSNGEHGEIIMINKKKLSKPVVHTNSDYIDLSKEKDLKIEEIVEH